MILTMKVLILITLGWFVVGCREFGAEKVVKAFDDVKVTGARNQAKVNVTDALAAKLGAIFPGVSEVKVQYGGQLRRLIVTTPKTFNRQNLYPILFCFHGAGGKADGPSRRWSPHADKHDLVVISVFFMETNTFGCYSECHDGVRPLL